MSKTSPRDETKPAYHHGDLAAAALEQALAVVESEGVEALSLRKLAQHLGVTHRALYRHYPDKGALIAQVAGAGYRALAGEAGGEGATGASFARAYVRFALRRPNLYAVMMARTSGEKPAELYAAIGALLKEARAAWGDELTVKRVWTILHGGVSLHQTGAYAVRSEEELIGFLLTLCGLKREQG